MNRQCHPVLRVVRLGTVASAAPPPGLRIRGDQEGEEDQQEAEEQKDHGDPGAPPGIGDPPMEQAQNLFPVKDDMKEEQD